MGNQIELLVNLQTIDLQLRERTDAIEVLRREIADLDARARRATPGARRRAAPNAPTSSRAAATSKARSPTKKPR